MRLPVSTRPLRPSPALVLAVIAIMAGLLGGCRSSPATNVQPPAAGVPKAAEEITGIYRTIHQSLLQLRANGDLSLIVPDVSASAGTYTLVDGELTVTTTRCKAQVGHYRVEVTGIQRAGKATLNITATDDSCAERLRYLTIDPWVYADS